MKTTSVWIIFAIAALTAVVEGHYYTSFAVWPPLGAFDQFEGYPYDDPYYQRETGFFEYQPFESPFEQSPTFWDLFQPPTTRYMNYEAQPESMINYIPVKSGSRITPNVYVKGRGYTTDRYVAPTMLKKYLAMNPR